MRARRGDRSERGFTLVEVMVSLLIAVVAIVGMIGLYRVQTRASQNSRHVTEASVLAGDKLEQLRTVVGVPTGSSETVNDLGVPTAGGFYSRQWWVTNQTTYVDLKVTVSWTEEGVGKSSTMIGRRTP